MQQSCAGYGRPGQHSAPIQPRQLRDFCQDSTAWMGFAQISSCSMPRPLNTVSSRWCRARSPKLCLKQTLEALHRPLALLLRGYIMTWIGESVLVPHAPKSGRETRSGRCLERLDLREISCNNSKRSDIARDLHVWVPSVSDAKRLY